jgi:hypothetical protein
VERWKWIAGYELHYQISDRGRIRSFYRSKRGRLMHPGLRGNQKDSGYWCVDLRRDGQLLRCRINRLVLTAFRGTPPTPSHEAAHLDGNSRNNDLHNLAWLTPRENNLQKRLHGTMSRGSRHPHAKMTEKSVAALRADYAAGGLTQAQVGARYGIRQAEAGKIIRRVMWAHV